MKIDNAQLAAFATVLSEGSFEAAARRLHLTPSAISQRLKQLEERLGQVLLQRTIPCQPTVAGKTLARFTGQLALLEAELLNEVGTGTGDVGEAPMPLRIPMVVNADSLDSWFIDVFDQLASTTAICFDIRVEDQDHSAALLKDGSVMAAVSASPDAVAGCLVEPLGVMRYLAVASPEFLQRHFAQGATAESFRQAPTLVFNRKDGLQQRFVACFTDEAVQAPSHYLPSTHGFVDAARRGLGWGMMPEHFVREGMRLGELCEIAPGHPLDVPLYWHRWRLDSPALKALSETVIRTAADALYAFT
jgi:LysR family transcriptional regulator, chromosome initiation inhibitor